MYIKKELQIFDYTTPFNTQQNKVNIFESSFAIHKKKKVTGSW